MSSTSSSSRPPSVFDVMMSASRSSSNLKKRKTLDVPLHHLVRHDDEDDKLDDIVKMKKINVANLKTEMIKKPDVFDPALVATWEHGERVPFMFLSLVFDMISDEPRRIVITDIACNMLRTVIQTIPEDLLPVVCLAANQIAPAREGLELGIGESSIIKALAEAYGCGESHIREKYMELGDLGQIAKESRSSQRMIHTPHALTVAKVFDTFHQITKESRKDSQKKKRNRIKSLLVAATDCEPQYVIRLLQKKLQIGLAQQTLLAALGQAAVYSEKNSRPPPHIKFPLEEELLGHPLDEQTQTLLQNHCPCKWEMRLIKASSLQGIVRPPIG